MANSKKILMFILIAAAFLRLYHLGDMPAGFFRDEAAIGYNAYSLWQTGKDEFGMKLPAVFRSFEVFFLPLYIYLTAPIVGVLGLTEFSSRLLSAVAGISTVYLIYLTGKKLWGENAGIFSAFILTIAPWHIYYSRGAFEGNLALTLFTAGFYFWLTYIGKYERKYFFLSALLFTLSMYSYQAERLVVPLFAVTAAVISRTKLLENGKKLIVAAFVVLIILIPLISLTFSAGGMHRAAGVSVFSKNERPVGWIENEAGGIFVNNIYFLRGKQLFSLYASYFSPRNLFIEGDFEKQRSVEDYSVFYAWMMPFLVIGTVSILQKRKAEEKLLIAWILFAPLPAAATADPFHTYRSLLLYLPLALLMGKGSEVVYKNIKKLKLTIEKRIVKSLYVTSLILIGIVSISFFVFNYAVISQATRARSWDYGYKEIVSFINTLPKDKRIIIDDPWTEPYIYVLFFSKEDPIAYQKEVAKLGSLADYYYSDGSEIRPMKFKNLEFRKADWPTERGDRGTVFIMWNESLPDSEFKGDPHVKLLKQIYYPDGMVAYKIVEIM